MKTVKQYAEEIWQNAENKGFHKDFNLRRSLMLIITEISEAVEADREKRVCKKENLEYFEKRIGQIGMSASFEDVIKDTKEDEIADAIIRILDLWMVLEKNEAEMIGKLPEYFNDSDEYYFDAFLNEKDFAVRCYFITGTIARLGEYVTVRMVDALNMLYKLAIDEKIDIEKHIQLKMEYNKTRDVLHGKLY